MTDDWPFFHNLTPKARLFNPLLWLSAETTTPYEKVYRSTLLLTVCLIFVSVILIIGPLFVLNGSRPSRNHMSFVFYFGAIGFGFMLIEIGLVRKLGLILGNPANAISVVLAALILSTGFGAIASDRLMAYRIGGKMISAGLIMYILSLVALYNIAAPSIIPILPPLKALIVIGAIFPLGILMGQLFPMGLRKLSQQDPVGPWAWGINATASTTSVALSYALGFALGFNVMLYLGMCFYAIIFLLPSQDTCYVEAKSSLRMTA